MFAKLHLLSQDVPEGGDGFQWRAHPYLRMAGNVPKGPVVFSWSARQRGDLEALWQDPESDGARERLARDLAAFCDKLGWTPDAEALTEAEKHGDEYMLTLSAVPQELYMLPWEVIQVGAVGTYLSDYASAQVRYSMPGLGPREIQTVPPLPGVLFAWSGAGGAVPHEEHAAAIRAAAEAGGVMFRELAEVDERSLQAALDDGPPSVLHLLCHGLPGEEGEPSRLKWGATDNPSEITAPRLARMLRPHGDAIRLVVLSTCGGGDGAEDPMLMGSIAQELHRKGIPSVVASRYPLSVRGSCVMTRVLYDQMLREAWSLERALRHTRETLFRVDEAGEAHPGDAYGIQLYEYDTEWFVSDNEVEAERPVLASYPFGVAAQPVPKHAPPPAELTLQMEEKPPLTGDELVDRLRRVSEDEGLIIEIRSLAERGAISLVVHTTVDGAQRLLGAWRSKALQVAIGVAVGVLVLTKGISAALGATLSASAANALGHQAASAAAGHIGGASAAAGHVGGASAAAGQAGAAGAAAGHAGAGAAAGQAGAASAAGAAAGQAGAASAAAGQAGTAGAAAGHAGAGAAAGHAGAGAAAGQAGAASAAAGQAGAASAAAGQAGAGAAAGQAGATSAVAGQAGAGAAAGQAGMAGAAAGQAGMAGAAAGQAGMAGAAAGQAGMAGAAASTGKAAAGLFAIAGKTVTAKLAIAALVSSAAVAGGAVVYRTETKSRSDDLTLSHGRTDTSLGYQSPPPGTQRPTTQPPSPQDTPAPPPETSPDSHTKPAPGSRDIAQSDTPGSTEPYAPATTATRPYPPVTEPPATAHTPTTQPYPSATIPPVTTQPNQPPTTQPNQPSTTDPNQPVATQPNQPSMTQDPTTTQPPVTTQPNQQPNQPVTTQPNQQPTAQPDQPMTTQPNQQPPTTQQPPSPTQQPPTQRYQPPPAQRYQPPPARPYQPPTAQPYPPTTTQPNPSTTTPPSSSTAQPQTSPSPPTGPGSATAPSPSGPSPVVSTAVCGNGILEAGEQCDDGNTSDGDGCSSTCIKDVLIDPTTLQSLLASGNTNVPPSKAVRDSMIRYHQSSLKATVGVCINTSGVVSQSRVRVGTGYDDYDRKLLATVRTWRYRPHVIDDRPTPACSTVEFIYNPG